MSASVGKLREDVHRQADHAQVIVQELFAGGVIGRVGFYADGFADVGQHLVDLAERVGGDVGEGGTLTGGNGFLDFGEVEAGGLVGPGAVGTAKAGCRASMPE